MGAPTLGTTGLGSSVVDIIRRPPRPTAGCTNGAKPCAAGGASRHRRAGSRDGDGGIMLAAGVSRSKPDPSFRTTPGESFTPSSAAPVSETVNRGDLISRWRPVRGREALVGSRDREPTQQAGAHQLREHAASATGSSASLFFVARADRRAAAPPLSFLCVPYTPICRLLVDRPKTPAGRWGGRSV